MYYLTKADRDGKGRETKLAQCFCDAGNDVKLLGNGSGKEEDAISNWFDKQGQ